MFKQALKVGFFWIPFFSSLWIYCLTVKYQSSSLWFMRIWLWDLGENGSLPFLEASAYLWNIFLKENFKYSKNTIVNSHIPILFMQFSWFGLTCISSSFLWWTQMPCLFPCVFSLLCKAHIVTTVPLSHLTKRTVTLYLSASSAQFTVRFPQKTCS